MGTSIRSWLFLCLAVLAAQALAQTTQKAVDVPTRPGVTQRLLLLTPPEPKAAVILFTGGEGWVQILPNGTLKRGGNFLVRSRQLFADQGLMVAVMDAPSDRQSAPFLSGFRQTPEHVADVKAVIAWLRTQTGGAVWLVGTSRGTQSAAHVAIELAGGADGPDGVVLTSTILTEEKGRPVTAMVLGKLRVPVLVVHHEQDGCRLCNFSDMPLLMDKLANSPRKQLLAFKGGNNVGDPCEAMAYHGFNGLEQDVVSQTAAWILAK